MNQNNKPHITELCQSIQKYYEHVLIKKYSPGSYDEAWKIFEQDMKDRGIYDLFKWD